jgi:phosphoribosylanthranilate isomerase
MPYPVPLLIRGINNLSDARYCAGMGADKLSFVLDPALPGHLTAAVVKELAGWVAGVELIGEFDTLPAPEINALAADCGLDAVLLRTPRPAAELAELAPPVLLEVPFGQLATFPAADYADAVAGGLLELPEAGAAYDEALGSDAVAILARQLPLWLGPGLHPHRARQVLAAVHPAGLVFASGEEIKPGLRDFDQLEAVFEALEEE